MAVEIATAYVSIVPTTTGIGAALQTQLNGPLTQVGTKAGGILGTSMGKAAAVAGGLLIATKAAQFFGNTLDAAREANRVSAITQGVIEATGGAAGITAKQIDELSTAISRKTGVDDEAIQSGASTLLTFKSIRNEVGKGNDVFNRATQSVVDLSQKFGSIDTASVQLGKALEDPVKGLASLTRVGVTFTAQQKEQIKALVETGDKLGAQTLLLDAIEGQVGGLAEAQATGADKARVAYGNLQEAIGNALLPVMENLANIVTPILNFFTALPAPVQSGVVVLGLMVGSAVALNVVLGTLKATATGLGLVKGVTALATQLTGATAAATGTTAAMGVTAGASTAMAGAFGLSVVASGGLVLALGAVLGLVIANDDKFRSFGGALYDFGAGAVDTAGKAGGAWSDFFRGFGGGINDATAAFAGFLTSIPDKIRGFHSSVATAARGMWDGITAAFRSAINSILRKWNALEFRVPSVDIPGLGKIGGAVIGFPDIPLLADGGHITGSGIAIVGEQGPEIVSLRAGATVAPLQGGGGLRFGDINITEAQDARQTAYQVLRRARKQAYLAGVS